MRFSVPIPQDELIHDAGPTGLARLAHGYLCIFLRRAPREIIDIFDIISGGRGETSCCESLIEHPSELAFPLDIENEGFESGLLPFAAERFPARFLQDTSRGFPDRRISIIQGPNKSVDSGLAYFHEGFRGNAVDGRILVFEGLDQRFDRASISDFRKSFRGFAPDSKLLILQGLNEDIDDSAKSPVRALQDRGRRVMHDFTKGFRAALTNIGFPILQNPKKGLNGLFVSNFAQGSCRILPDLRFFVIQGLDERSDRGSSFLQTSGIGLDPHLISQVPQGFRRVLSNS